MSTRRVEVGGETLHFDHGAQYFTARDPEFVAFVNHWLETANASRWKSAGDDAFVGDPSMSAPLEALSIGLDVTFSMHVHSLERRENAWAVLGDGWEEAGFEALVIALPAEQAVPLLEPHDQNFAKIARSTPSEPCWTIMVRFTESFDHPDTLRDAGAIGWAARNSAKPGRGGRECWVVQANPDWSRAHLEADANTAATALLAAFGEAAGRDLPAHDHLAAHRWRFARSGAADRDYLWNDRLRIGACGDWLLGPRVENAFLSGSRLGARIRSDLE